MTPLERVQAATAEHMEEIQKWFKPGTKITVLVRAPGFPERDFMMTDDTEDEIIAMVQRRKAAGPDKR